MSSSIPLLIMDVGQGKGGGLGVSLVGKGSDPDGHVPGQMEVGLMARGCRIRGCLSLVEV